MTNTDRSGPDPRGAAPTHVADVSASPAAVGATVALRRTEPQLHRAHGMNRLGRRFLAAMLVVLGVAILMIAIAAQTMFINEHDLELLMWFLIPAVLGAAMVAVLMARPVARDSKRICDAAMRVADGDLSARTGVILSLIHI